MTIAEELFFRGSPYGVGFGVVGLWCLLILPFEYVICRGG